MTSGPVNSKTAFLPVAETFPKDDNERIVKITNLHSNIANAINVREISLYENELEVLTGQQYSVVGDSQNKRYTYRKLFYFGAIATGATLNIAHGITGLVQLTDLHGGCVTDVIDFRPVPFVSTVALNEQISVRIVGANIELINGAGGPNITSGNVVIEYLLN
jgi:hypothetical protein